MTPKEEAIQLVKDFYFEISTAHERNKHAKKCALICVDKIYHIKMKYGRYEGYKDYWNYYSFWEEVKQEINNYETK